MREQQGARRRRPRRPRRARARRGAIARAVPRSGGAITPRSRRPRPRACSTSPSTRTSASTSRRTTRRRRATSRGSARPAARSARSTSVGRPAALRPSAYALAARPGRPHARRRSRSRRCAEDGRRARRRLGSRVDRAAALARRLVTAPFGARRRRRLPRRPALGRAEHAEVRGAGPARDRRARLDRARDGAPRRLRAPASRLVELGDAPGRYGPTWLLAGRRLAPPDARGARRHRDAALLRALVNAAPESLIARAGARQHAGGARVPIASTRCARCCSRSGRAVAAGVPPPRTTPPPPMYAARRPRARAGLPAAERGRAKSLRHAAKPLDLFGRTTSSTDARATRRRQVPRARLRPRRRRGA